MKHLGTYHKPRPANATPSTRDLFVMILALSAIAVIGLVTFEIHGAEQAKVNQERNVRP